MKLQAVSFSEVFQENFMGSKNFGMFADLPNVLMKLQVVWF